MDKIWDRKSFKVGGHWPLWRGMKNTNDQTSNAKNKTKKTCDPSMTFGYTHCLINKLYIIGYTSYIHGPNNCLYI